MLTPAPGTLLEIGGNGDNLKSVQLIKSEVPEGCIASTRPFAVGPPKILWGREILSQWGMRLAMGF